MISTNTGINKVIKVGQLSLLCPFLYMVVLETEIGGELSRKNSIKNPFNNFYLFMRSPAEGRIPKLRYTSGVNSTMSKKRINKIPVAKMKGPILNQSTPTQQTAIDRFSGLMTDKV